MKPLSLFAKIQLAAAAFIFTAMFNPHALAQGNHTGGGDSVIRLPDGSVVIADPFVVEQSKVIRMNPIMESYFGWAKQILSTYSLCPSAGRTLEPVLNNFTDIHLVSYLPDDPICLIEGALPIKQTENNKTELAACTINGQTYVRQDIFNILPLADQVSILVHERLHAMLTQIPRKIDLDPARVHLQIFAIAGGVKTTLNKLYKQQNGDRTPVSASEYTAIQGLISGLNTLGESCGSNGFGVWLNGGGLVNSAALGIQPGVSHSIDQSAFVGIGSLVNGSASLVLDAKTEVLNADITAPNIYVGENVKVIDSTIYAQNEMKLNMGANISSSRVLADKIRVATGATITRANLATYSSPGSIFGTLSIGANASIDKVTLRFASITNFKRGGVFGQHNNKQYMINTDVSIGTRVKLKQIFFPNYILPPYEEARIATKPENLIGSSPFQVYLSDNLMLDRSSDPFRGCLNRSPGILSDDQVTIEKDRDLELQFCNLEKQYK